MMDHRQKPGSPGDILEHHGIKGMRWGVREGEEPAKGSNGKLTEVQKEKQGLTRNQKIGIGVGAAAVVGVAGFMAYRTYAGGAGGGTSAWGIKNNIDSGIYTPKSPTPKKLIEGGLFNGGLGRKHPSLELLDQDNLIVNLSKGYADIRPKAGFATPADAARHAELLKNFEAFREKYPAIKNLAVEVVPMSHAPGLGALEAGRSGAAVMAIKPGEARLFYNDTMGALSASDRKVLKGIQPGVLSKNFLGHHEMGHMLAVANGQMPPAFDINTNPGNSFIQIASKQRRYANQMFTRHTELFKKHGFSFEELSKLSPYAASAPQEALAELSGYYHTPSLRSKLTPEQIVKAKALFDDIGGL